MTKHGLWSGSHENRIVMDKVFQNHLKTCIIDCTLTSQKFSRTQIVLILVGLKLDELSQESFLCNGTTFPTFSLSGKIPDPNERLMIDDRGCAMYLLRIFNKNKGIL